MEADHPSLEILDDAFHDVFFGGADEPPVAFGDEIYYPYPVGDIDKDGTDDFVLDTYCVEFDRCVSSSQLVFPKTCGEPHRLQAVSGRDGHLVWSRDLSPDYDLPFAPPDPVGCMHNLVIGTIPGSDGTEDLLVYRWEATPYFAWTAVAIKHEYYAVDGVHGDDSTKDPWHSEPTYGAWTSATLAGFTARDVFLIPFLDGVPVRGSLIPKTAQEPTLLIRGWGFHSTNVGIAIQPLIPFYWYSHVYQPIEWAARIDLADGAELWHKDTFTPQADRSVYPEARPHKWFVFHWTEYGTSPYVCEDCLPWSYFYDPGCCGDVTGDGVADLTFSTLEYFFENVTSVPGFLEGNMGHMVVFDGATGNVAWKQEIAADSKTFQFASFAPGADFDGDGAREIVSYAFYFRDYDFHESKFIDPLTVLSIRSGKDGHELWRLEEPTVYPFDVLPLGDATHDGAIDLLLVHPHLDGYVSRGLTYVSNFTLEFRDGRDGRVLWERSVKEAALDYSVFAHILEGNGIPDFDNDGVGDPWIDAVEELPDQTVIHHLQTISGASGANRSRFDGVGAFDVLIGATDLDGDNREDLVMAQGDGVDLWVAAIRENDGKPLWSRRLIAIAQANAYDYQPGARLSQFQLDDDPELELLLVFRAGVDGRSYESMHALDTNGHSLWSLPAMDDPDESLIANSLPSAAEAWNKAHLLEDPSDASTTGGLNVAWAAAGVTLVGSIGGGFLFGGRRGMIGRRPPDGI